MVMTELESTPQEIMDFLYGITGKEAEIERARDGGPRYQISTDMGASFRFEVRGETESEVARNYFNHCVYTYRHILKHSKWFWSRLRRKYTAKDRREYVRRLEKMCAWYDAHLRT